MLRVTVLCSDPAHPVNVALVRWSSAVADHACAQIVRTVPEALGGDFLFLVSCHQVVRREDRARYRHVLVLHASALPEGRGMSPHVWQILEGRTDIAVSLINAEDAVDSGAIWRQVSFHVPRSATFAEINEALFAAEMELMSWALVNCDRETPRTQFGDPSFYRRRTPADSEIDPGRPIAESFDIIRTSDPVRYPAHFHLFGRRFRITIDPMP